MENIFYYVTIKINYNSLRKATVSMVKGQNISIREWENGLRDAFDLSRSEAKQAAKAIVRTFTERDASVEDETLRAIRNLTQILKP